MRLPAGARPQRKERYAAPPAASICGAAHVSLAPRPEELGLEPIARVVSTAVVVSDPSCMGRAPFRHADCTRPFRITRPADLVS